MAFNLTTRSRLAIGAAALVAIGAAGGAGAVSLTRPSVEMAPTVATPIARIASTSGVVTVKGRVAEVYGDRMVLQDGTGRVMVDIGREGRDAVRQGAAMTVQGRYRDGQLHASYLIDPQGRVEAVGPGGRPPHGPGGPGSPRGPGRDALPPPPPGGPNAGPGAAPPPPPPCPTAAVAVPPPPAVTADGQTPVPVSTRR